MAKEAKSTVVPRLRFPEFRDHPAWKAEKLEKLISTVIPPVKLPSSNYQPTGRFPIIDQSKEFICGWTDDSGAVITEPLPLIVFGDHTCALKFVKQPFAQGADGIKILTAEHAIAINYLFHALTHQPLVMEDYKRHFATLTERKVLFPEVESGEQQKIADCLTSLDEVIAAQGRKVDALKTYKRGLMQQLFPREGETVPRLRFPEFRDGPDWESPSIQDLIDRQFIVGHLDGNHGELYPRADEFSATGIPYITANDFRIGHVVFDTCKRLPMERALKFKKGVARDGDILFAHNATVGPVAKLDTAYDFVILSTTATYFRCNQNGLLNDFLLFALTSPSFVAQYTRVMSQSTRDQVPITTQRKFFLQIPNLQEQYRIASCLSALDVLIVGESTRLDTLKSHKNGLMQQLFPSPEEA